MIPLTATEKERLQTGIISAMAIPFIDDIEDFIWEAVFAYVKGLEIDDPLSNIRSKLLFDVTNKERSIGWSCKALQCSVRSGCEFELVIQRADIFKKARTLGFDKLTIESSPKVLGKALLKHWHEKINKDSAFQKVKDKRVAILIKSRDRKRYGYYEDTLCMLEPDDLEWSWTDSTKTGLQGKRKKDKFCVYRWYPNQKQFFERFQLSPKTYLFSIEPSRIPLHDVINLIRSVIMKGKT